MTDTAPKYLTLVRVLGITLGIISLTILAWKGTDIPFHAVFLQGLEILENGASYLVRPFELVVIQPAFEWVRERGWNIALYPHWKYSFALLWLFFAAVARAYSTRNDLVQTIFDWSWGAIVALVAGVASGTEPIANSAVFWWPATAFCLYMWGSIVWDAVFRPAGDEATRRSDFAQGQAWLLFAFVIAALGAAGVSLAPLFSIPTKSPGLALLFIAIVSVALYFILLKPHKHPYEGANRGIGLDILTVVGGTIALVAVNQIWLTR